MTERALHRPGGRTRPWLVLSAVCALLWSGSLVAVPKVVASIAPVHALAAAIMGGLGEPVQIVRGYGSPHAYQMRPSDAANLRDADLLLWIGPSLETFLQRPLVGRRDGSRVVALSSIPGLALLANRPGGVRHDDAHGEAGSYDPHIWLSPFNAKLMAGAIATQLSDLDPENAEIYQTNLDSLRERIDAMESRIASRLAPVASVPFVVFHDAFQYFEETFGLNAVGSVTVSPDHMPSARRIKALKKEIAESGARCVFLEPQFESALVQVLLEDSDARAGMLDPLGIDVTRGPDAYLELMDANADALLACLGR
jgi:zinc transport system substrate-binding protein